MSLSKPTLQNFIVLFGFREVISLPTLLTLKLSESYLLILRHI